MRNYEIILGTGDTEKNLEWVPERITRYMGQIASLHDAETTLVPPFPIVRKDNRTLFACSGVQIIYPQIYEDSEIPDKPQLISQPVIRTQHLDHVKEGTSTSFVNYNLVAFGVSEDYHKEKTEEFFSKMIEADESGTLNYKRVLVEDWEQTWDGLPVVMNTNDKLWINGVELGESIYFRNMPLPSGDTVSVSELAFGLERLFYATEDTLDRVSYFSAMLGGVDSEPVSKGEASAAVCDTVKSTTLMAMQGVIPSNKAHGYRMRKFLKKAVTSNESAGLDIEQLIKNAYSYWENFFVSDISVEEVTEVIDREFGRNQNRRLLDLIHEKLGIEINLDINQDPEDFKTQLQNTGRIQNIGDIHFASNGT